MHFGSDLSAKRIILAGLAAGAALVCVLVTTASVMSPPGTHRKMALTSSAFKEGQPIPSQYTCDGKNISPPLTWNGAPAGTASLAIIVDDPDAPMGVWTHWVLFNLPPDSSDLPEGAAQSESALHSAVQGRNDFKRLGYGGPCPPAGKQHRYFFKTYALDITLNLAPGATSKEVQAAMTKHILAEGQLMGTYQKK